MATSSSPISTRPTVDMKLVEYTFARWVYIDKCRDYVDQYGRSVPDIVGMVDILGSEAACIRALILHGHMAKDRQTRGIYSKGGRGLKPLEAFQEALRIGLAVAKVLNVKRVDIPTRPWERTARSVHWLASRFFVPRAGRPVLIPSPLTGPSSLWYAANPSGTSTASGTEVISAPRELYATETQLAVNVRNDFSAMWSCSHVDILYRNGEGTTYPRQPNMKPFVVTGLPAVHLYVLPHPRPKPGDGHFHTTARSVTRQDVKDTPMLVLWSCAHGDLFVQTPKEGQALPPVSSNFVNPPVPSASISPSGQISPQQYALAYQGNRCPPLLPASHTYPVAPPQFQHMLRGSYSHPHQNQPPMLPSFAPHPMHGMPPFSQLSVQGVYVRGPVNPQIQSVGISTQHHAQALPLPRAASPRPAPSLSVFQPRVPPASTDVPPLPLGAAPSVSVSKKKKRARRSDPVPGSSSKSTSRSTKPSTPVSPAPAPTPSASAPTSSACALKPSTSAPTLSTSVPTSSTLSPTSFSSVPPSLASLSTSASPSVPAAATSTVPSSSKSAARASSTSAPASSTPTTRPTPPTQRRGSEKTPCGLDNCTVALTPSSWEKHYETAHNISETTWVPDTLCPHPACRDALAAAASSPRTQPKFTLGIWSTYKRHVKQMHFPKGRTHPCTFPGCDAVLSRGDALLRHVETKHKVAHDGRERAGKRARADDEEWAPKKKAREGSSPSKAKAQRAMGFPKKTSTALNKASGPLIPSSRKGKEVVRPNNRCPSAASASSGSGPSTFRTSEDDIDMFAQNQDQEMAQSEDFEFDDEWPQGDFIEDEMDSDFDNYD